MSLDMLKDGAMAVIGGLISSLIGLAYWTRLHKKVDDSAEEIKRLRDDNFAKLDKKVDEHIKDDKSQLILTKLDNLSGLVGKVSDKVDAVKEETARQGEAIKNNADFNRNLYGSLQTLRQEVHKK
jgi:hypothetical protein